MTLSLRFSALSDVGRVRKENQDSGYAGPHLLLVADGVGGAARGDVASATTVHQMRTLDEHAPELGISPLDTLVAGITVAHSRIGDLVADSPELDGTSTTVVAGLFTGSEIVIAHVGDSRAYLLRDGQIQPLTRDHSFVQSLVDEGRITEEEARTHPNRNLILRAVDGVHEPNPDTSMQPLQAGDRLLLCSDGCCGVLTDEQIGQILGSDNVDHVASALVTASLDAGSTDNVTVVVAEVIEGATEDDDNDQVPITVGAAAHPLRPTSRSGRLRRRLTEIVVDPEVARYAPRPPRRNRILRFGLVLVVLLLLAAGVLYGAYQWTQTQYYIGDSEGYVAVYQGEPGSVFGLSLHHVVTRSDLLVSTLGDGRESIEDNTSVYDSKSKAEAKLASLKSFIAECQKAETPPPPKPTPTPKKRPVGKKTAHKPTSSPTHQIITPSSTPNIPAGCPTP
ncbi:MAG TPA: protein phosphatase 2C domain-containing protein [Marmoricola sp.]|nr:protein phosphatase 2C domain-containing protein [Marmoricola sp.]